MMLLSKHRHIWVKANVYGQESQRASQTRFTHKEKTERKPIHGEKDSHSDFLSCPLFFHLPTGHAKEALELARMQEQSTQMEHQGKIKVLQKKETITVHDLTLGPLHVLYVVEFEILFECSEMDCKCPSINHNG